jgi:hypothetical protein
MYIRAKQKRADGSYFDQFDDYKVSVSEGMVTASYTNDLGNTYTEKGLSEKISVQVVDDVYWFKVSGKTIKLDYSAAEDLFTLYALAKKYFEDAQVPDIVRLLEEPLC